VNQMQIEEMNVTAEDAITESAARKATSGAASSSPAGATQPASPGCRRSAPSGGSEPHAVGSVGATKLEREDHKLEKRLCREVGRAIVDFNMIEEGDKVMVCVSGGKDSYAMLDILLKLQKRAPINFELVAVNLDQKQPGFPEHVLPDYLSQLGVPYHIENQDTYSIVTRVIPEGKTLCSLCSRLRRGILYRVAGELGATKIALGHHRDDMLQTFFLNMFFAAKLKGMPPKLVSDDGRNIVIRPMAYVPEKDLIRWAQVRDFPIIPCTLCGSQENLQRKQVGNMLRDWQKQYPGRVENMFSALQNIVPSHLMDSKRHDFKGIRATGVADAQGDKAFDAEEFSEPAMSTGLSAIGVQVI
jgi:tRNA 2-thiocytidine biosynthesis protein TtcA